MVFVLVEDMLYKKKIIHNKRKVSFATSKKQSPCNRYICFRSRLYTQKTRLSIINNDEISCRHTIRKVLSPAQASGRMLSQYVTGSSVCRAV